MSINHNRKATIKDVIQRKKANNKTATKAAGFNIDTLPDTINTLVEAEDRAQCSQVVEEENTTHTLLFLVCSVSCQCLYRLAEHNMPMHSPHFERRVFT